MISRERRAHVRGDIFFKVKYRIITPEEYAVLKGSEGENISPATGEEEVHISPEREQGVLDPSLIDFLLHLDEKLDRVLSLLEGDRGDEGGLQRALGTNISGSGMRIFTEHPIETGRLVQTRFVLSRVPLVYVEVLGEVVRVTPVEEEGRTHYGLGIQFLDLKVSDREKIIACVFRKQREALRQKRSERVPPSLAEAGAGT